MSAAINWIKNNKITSLLIIVVVFLVFEKSTPVYQAGLNYAGRGLTLNKTAESMMPLAAGDAVKPTTSTQNRMVITDSYLSLVVKNVGAAQQLIVKKAQESGGFMVYSSLNNPAENANASVTVRIPGKSLQSILNYYKTLALKVVAENLSREDVTNQYTDIDARLATLNKTKAIFEDMLDKAATVADILNVQRELLNVQDQIDAQIGQKKYLQENINLTKITVYLSTDELSLPYAPLEVWRPGVIFKEAVRSLIGFGRMLAGSLIWLGVYAVVWLPILLIVFIVKKRFAKKHLVCNNSKIHET